MMTRPGMTYVYRNLQATETSKLQLIIA